MIFKTTAAIVFSLAFTACSDSTSPSKIKSKIKTGDPSLQTALRAALIVSGPLPARDYGYAPDASSDAEYVYVSMRPGSLWAGDSLVLLVSSSPQSPLDANRTNGGFDPIPLLARAGDSLDAALFVAGVASRVRIPIPGSRPPSVVRTSPDSGLTNVELGQQIQIVFSQPIDSSTATASSIQLTTHGSVVASTIASRPQQPWLVVVSPSAQLAPDSLYDVTIAGTVADVSGASVAAPETFNFFTGTNSGTSAPECAAGSGNSAALAPGTYQLSAIDGAPPPFLLPFVQGEHITVTGGSITMGADASFTFELDEKGSWQGYSVAPGYSYGGSFRICGSTALFYHTDFTDGTPTTSLYLSTAIAHDSLRSTVSVGAAGSDGNGFMDWVFTRVQ